VGRSAELAIVSEVLTACQDGQPSITLVVGDAGVGKSRLVREACEQARAAGAFVLRGECLALSREFAYAPIVGALRDAGRGALAVALERLPPDKRAQIGRLVPEVESAAQRDEGSSPTGQGRLFELLLALLRHLGEESPVVFVIEDGHWADASTRDFLSFLARNLSDERVAVVVTYRPDELQADHPLMQLLAELMRTDIVTRIELTPLARDDIERMLEHITGEPPAVLLVDEIFARSQGNPFFAEELLAAPTTGAGRILPTSLRDALLVRLHSLPEMSLELLRLLAVLGRPADHDLLALVSGLQEPALSAALRAARTAHVIAHRPHDDLFEFRHALVREALWADLLPGERTALHRSIARTLAAAGRGTAAELALHWDAGGEPAAALDAYVQAALDAQEVCASAEARTHFERAARLWGEAGSGPVAAQLDRADLLRHAAESARLMGDWDAAVALADEALELVDAKAEPLRAAMLHERIGEYHLWDDEAALACYSQALATLPEAFGRERARILAAQALALHFLQRWEESRACAQQALDEARAAGARTEEGYAANVLGIVLAFLGDPIRGQEHVRLAKQIAEDGGSAEEVARTYIHLGEVLRVAGDFAGALEVMLAGETAAAAMGMAESFGRAMSVNAAEDLLHLGRWDEAAQRLRWTARLKLSPLTELMQRIVEGRLAVGRGEFRAAADALADAHALCDPQTDVAFLTGTHGWLAELALWEGRPKDARRAVADAFERIGDKQDPLYTPVLFWLAVRAEVDVAVHARGRGGPAATLAADTSGAGHLSRLERLIERYSVVVAPAGADAYLRLSRAELTRIGDDPRPDRWAAAARSWRALRRPDLEAYALWRAAEAALVSSRPRGDAAEDLRTARRIAAQLGAAPLLREVDALARAARIDVAAERELDAPPQPQARARFGLTAREMDVLRLVADGSTNRQIAEQLFITEKTASVHVSHILSKLDAENRVRAAAIAHQFSLLDTPATTD
jgi:DNA-binding CsgD family transcriptional regulator